MKTFPLLAALAMVMMALSACNSDSPTTPTDSTPITLRNQYVIPGATVFPEGVTVDTVARRFYVGSSNDGTIFRGGFGDSAAAEFLTGGGNGRTSAAGMKLDGKGHLLIAGGMTGAAWVYDTSGTFIARLDDGVAGDSSFMNDIAIAPNGIAYATDSRDSIIYRLTPSGNSYTLERWLSLAGSPIVYGPGFNLNGIVSGLEGKYLIAVQSNTGKLFRITIADRTIEEIKTNTTDSLTNGDGLLLLGSVLYLVRNQNREIVKLAMSGDYTSAVEVSRTTNGTFDFPTTIATAGGRLIVVNGQLNKRMAGTAPNLPFILSTVPIP